MDRIEEIRLILKDLFKRLKREISENEYSDSLDVMLKSSREISKLSKMIEEYTQECRNLK